MAEEASTQHNDANYPLKNWIERNYHSVTATEAVRLREVREKESLQQIALLAQAESEALRELLSSLSKVSKL